MGTRNVVAAGGATGSAEAPGTASAPPADRFAAPGEIAFREQRELDDPVQFLHVPAELADLIERLSAPVDARMAVFVDARGAVTRIEIDGMIDAADDQALRAALQAAAFMPGRLGGVAVASVKRIEMRGLDDGMRVIASSAPLAP